MLRKIFFVFIVMVLVTTFAFASGGEELWKPNKPITLIVPWSAGGATDQITRLCAGELEEALGQKIVIVNQSGASGSVGTKTVMDAAKDGYTWASGAVGDVGGKLIDIVRRRCKVSGRVALLYLDVIREDKKEISPFCQFQSKS